MELATKEERTENLIIDFAISSILAMTVIIFTYRNFIIGILTYYFVRFTYYFCFELLTGKTIGKYETQTKITNECNQKPKIYKLALRNLIRFISISSLVSDNRKLIHDLTSNTFVVKDINSTKIEITKYLNYIICIFLILSNIFLSKDSKSDGGILITIYLIFVIYAIVHWSKNKNYS